MLFAFIRVGPRNGIAQSDMHIAPTAPVETKSPPYSKCCAFCSEGLIEKSERIISRLGDFVKGVVS